MSDFIILTRFHPGIFPFINNSCQPPIILTHGHLANTPSVFIEFISQVTGIYTLESLLEILISYLLNEYSKTRL